MRSELSTSAASDRAQRKVEILERIRSEYLEMPGLRLKSEQLQRLCGVDRTICEQVLKVLVDMNFLARKPDGAYARATDGADPLPLNERRRGRSVEELRRQRDEMKREWERRSERRGGDDGVQLSEAAGYPAPRNPLTKSNRA